MHAVINCRSILKKTHSGIGRYTFQLVHALAGLDQQNKYSLYCPQGFFDFKRQVPDAPGSNFRIRRDYFKQGPERVCGSHDLYHSPSPDDLFKVKGNGKLIVTVHDLIYKTYPQGHTKETIALTDRFIRQALEKAHKIICVSQSTQEDLRKFFNLSADRSCVIYHGVDHQTFYPQDDKRPGWLMEAGITKPFILFVGTLEPRKNLAGLLKSFALLKSSRKFNGQLVITGMKGWMNESIPPLIKSLEMGQDIVFMGFVSDQQLRDLYNRTEVFVFPSFYEGFGFPILEAFCCAAPVITSNTSSCKEIAGNAAVLTDPGNPESIAQAIARVLDDESLRAKLRREGLSRCQEFSFLKTAQETLNIYQEVAG